MRRVPLRAPERAEHGARDTPGQVPSEDRKGETSEGRGQGIGAISHTGYSTRVSCQAPPARDDLSLLRTRSFRRKNFHKMVGLAAQPPNVPVVPPSERVASKPAIREYDPHVGYPPSTKQWYTFVRLDEYGPGASDAELRELEERILSEPDDTSDDDALETLSGASANDEALLEDVEPEHKPHPQHQAAYVKPGGPCDHCGAAGTFRDARLSLFSSAAPRASVAFPAPETRGNARAGADATSRAPPRLRRHPVFRSAPPRA